MTRSGARAALCTLALGAAFLLAFFGIWVGQAQIWSHRGSLRLAMVVQEQASQLRSGPTHTALQGSALPRARPFRAPAEYRALSSLLTATNPAQAGPLAGLPEAVTLYMGTQVAIHAQHFAAPDDATHYPGSPAAASGGTARLSRSDANGDRPTPEASVAAAFDQIYVLTQPGRTRQQTLAHHTLRALGLSYTMCYTIPPPPAASEALLAAGQKSAAAAFSPEREPDRSAATGSDLRTATAAELVARKQQAPERLRVAASHWWILNRIAGGAIEGTGAGPEVAGGRHRQNAPTSPQKLEASFLVLTDTALVNPATFVAALATLQHRDKRQSGGQDYDGIRSAELLLLGRPESGSPLGESADASIAAAYAVSPQAAARLASNIARMLIQVVAADTPLNPVLAAAAMVAPSTTTSADALSAPLSAVCWPLIQVLAAWEATLYAPGPPAVDAGLAKALNHIGPGDWPIPAQRQALLQDLGLPTTPPSDSSLNASHAVHIGDQAGSTAHLYGSLALQDMAVCIAFFSPARAKRPLALLRQSVATYAAQGAPVFVMELVYDDEVPQLQSLEGATVFHVRSHSVMFHKENLWNLLAARVPLRYTKLLFLDANVLFFEAYWYEAISHALDTHPIVQPFQAVTHTTADRTAAIRFQPGLFAALAARGREKIFTWSTAQWPAAGFGMAVQRSWLAEVGGFMDMAVMGGGDMLLCSVVHGLGITWNRAWSHQGYAHGALALFAQRIQAAGDRRKATRGVGQGSNAATLNRDGAVASGVGLPAAVTSGAIGAFESTPAVAPHIHAFEWTRGASLASDQWRSSVLHRVNASVFPTFAAVTNLGATVEPATPSALGEAAWAPLTAEHLFHGVLAKRQHASRHELPQALRAGDFWRNADGVLEFVDPDTWNPITRAYFAARGEDE